MLGALEAHDCHFATLVGEETAEPVSGTGMVFQLALPNSNLRMQMTTRIFSFPSHPSGEGVKPDIVAPRSVRDVALGKDPALAAIRAQLGPHECP
jgi:C-terminal processing protease CtpA/Prc